MAYTTITAATIGLADGDAGPEPLGGTVRITPRFPAASTDYGIVATGPVVVEVDGGTFPKTLIPGRDGTTAFVEFHLHSTLGPVDMPPTEVPIEPSTTISLHDFLPTGVESSSGQIVVRGPRGPGLNDISASDGEITFSWDDGHSTAIDVPEAVPGPRGPKGRDGDIVGVGVPVFDSRASAADWELSNPGRRAMWIDGIPELGGTDNGLVPTRFDAMTGMPPSGWSAHWNTMAKTPRLAAEGYMEIIHNAAARWAFTHDMTGDVGDVDIVTKIRMLNFGGSSNQYGYGLIAGVSGEAGNETGTYCYAMKASPGSTDMQVRLGEYNGGASSIETFDTSVPFTEWSWIRMNVSGGTLKVKVWADLLDEPTAWTWTKAGLTAKTGRVGFFNSGIAEADVAYFNASTTGTAGIV